MSKEINVELTGLKIKRLCEERGIGVKDLQQILEFESSQAIYKWFEGRNIPSTDNLVKLSDVLEVSINELIVLNNSIKEEETND